MRSLFLASAAILFAAGGFHPAAKQSTGTEKFRGYRSWYCDTPQALDMDAKLALRCLPPNLPQDPMDPHERYFFKIWVNPAGKQALLAKNSIPFPVGSIVVKEKYKLKNFDQLYPRDHLSPNAKPVLLTAMVKREKGYDAANGDWEYVVLNGDATQETTAGLEHCSGCHMEMKSRDFIFRRHSDGGPKEHLAVIRPILKIPPQR